MKERLRQLRKALNLTQAEFAGRIGSVQNTITGYENGKRNPSNPVISSICKEFNVNEDWLRNGTGEMFLPDAETELDKLVKRYNLSPGIRAFISKLVGLPPESQEVLISFMKDVVDSISDSEEDLPEGGADRQHEESLEERRRRLHDELDRQLDEEEEVKGRSEVS